MVLCILIWKPWTCQKSVLFTRLPFNWWHEHILWWLYFYDLSCVSVVLKSWASLRMLILLWHERHELTGEVHSVARPWVVLFCHSHIPVPSWYSSQLQQGFAQLSVILYQGYAPLFMEGYIVCCRTCHLGLNWQIKADDHTFYSPDLVNLV